MNCLLSPNNLKDTTFFTIAIYHNDIIVNDVIIIIMSYINNGKLYYLRNDSFSPFHLSLPHKIDSTIKSVDKPLVSSNHIPPKQFTHKSNHEQSI